MRRLVLSLVLVSLPLAGRADRGALTVEAGPALTWWPRLQPPIGRGSGVAGSSGGGQVGLRFGLRHDLDLFVGGFYEAEAPYTHAGVTVGADGGSFTGALSSRTGRWGVAAGARYVTGLVVRLFVGAEVGWTQQSYRRVDLIDVSDPANPHSFGLGTRDRTSGALVLAPLAGVEWQVSDRWSLSFAPRVQLMIGDVGRFAVSLPVTVGYSWYGW